MGIDYGHDHSYAPDARQSLSRRDTGVPVTPV
ncbi:hypothetical protein SAMN05216284_12354 [Micromonospora sediminimaris]|nr:hypothetical protein SAMN05216284_12354 [Micromonospora sediminimaris]